MGNRWGIQSKFFIIPVIASILILGGFGLSQDAFSIHLPSPPPAGSPTIQIIKETTNGDGSFAFTIFNASNPADRVFVNIPDTSINDMTTPLTLNAGNPPLNKISVIEPFQINWMLTSSDCKINGVSHGSALNFEIINGDIVVCTFKNTFVPPPAVCGNGVIETGEQCDDNNTVTESCDYNLMSCNVCAADCTNQAGATSFCGDSNIDSANGETCDDGANNGTPGLCNATCDGIEPPVTCDLADVNNAPPGQCADVPVNQICEFACDAGFEPVPPTLTCQGDGNFDATPACEAITDNQCDGEDATIFKKFPGNDNSNTFVVDGVDVEMVRWDKDKNTTIEANEGWIIKGTGNKRDPLPDVVVGTEKDDKITPGWGDDIVCARAGDDLVQGSWGKDRLFGEDGDDLLKGGWNDDFLDGGADTDEAQGGKNSDTCIAETVSSCEA